MILAAVALSNGHPDGNLYRGAYLGNIGVEVVGRLDHGVIQIRRNVSTAKVKRGDKPGKAPMVRIPRPSKE